MTTIFDDRPHPIPSFAYLRYKENYFFVIMDKENDVYGVSHLNSEPLFDRTRFTLELNVKGKAFRYANEIPLPKEFALSGQLSDGVLTLRFIEPQKEFRLSCHNDEIDMDLTFLGRYSAFDFSACRYTAPDMMSVQENLTCGLNLPYNHQQQSLRVKGNVDLKKTGIKAELNGLGYRDHSWVMRADTLVRNHFWTGLNFPERAFGVKTIQTMARAGIWGKEGYICDADGDRALTGIDVSAIGDKGGWPEMVTFQLRDGLGKSFTIEADVGNRYSDVQLVSEKFEPGKAYNVIETFSPLKLLETGEQGIGLVEIGIHDLAR